jgi:hypothetical protein
MLALPQAHLDVDDGGVGLQHGGQILADVILQQRSRWQSISSRMQHACMHGHRHADAHAEPCTSIHLSLQHDAAACAHGNSLAASHQHQPGCSNSIGLVAAQSLLVAPKLLQAAHLVGRQFGLLRDDGAVQVAQHVALLLHQAHLQGQQGPGGSHHIASHQGATTLQQWIVTHACMHGQLLPSTRCQQERLGHVMICAMAAWLW